MMRNKAKILAFLLAILCGDALAEWTLVGRDADLRLYVDRGNILRQGDIAAMVQLVDHTSAQWVGSKVIMSVRNVAEFDCARRKTRTVAGTAYSEPLARGLQVGSERDPDAPWLDFPADSTAEQLWKIACGRE